MANHFLITVFSCQGKSRGKMTRHKIVWTHHQWSRNGTLFAITAHRFKIVGELCQTKQTKDVSSPFWGQGHNQVQQRGIISVYLQSTLSKCTCESRQSFGCLLHGIRNVPSVSHKSPTRVQCQGRGHACIFGLPHE